MNLSKQEVKEIATHYGCTTRYNGEDKTMYIHGLNDVTCVGFIQGYGRETDFKVVAHSTVPVQTKKHARGR